MIRKHIWPKMTVTGIFVGISARRTATELVEVTNFLGEKSDQIAVRS